MTDERPLTAGNRRRSWRRITALQSAFMALLMLLVGLAAFMALGARG